MLHRRDRELVLSVRLQLWWGCRPVQLLPAAPIADRALVLIPLLAEEGAKREPDRAKPPLKNGCYVSPT